MDAVTAHDSFVGLEIMPDANKKQEIQTWNVQGENFHH